MDPRQLEQVIINLATNARDAMPSGGRLRISTDTAVVGDGEPAPVTVGVRAGRYAVLIVEDSGIGMDGETRRQVFDPFFTTKELGKGTGLGLATVHGVVEQSGGHIVVDSQPGQGSRFVIYLPRAAEDAAAEDIAEGCEVTDAVLSGRQTPKTTPPARILVAEDHPLVRAVLSRVLLDLGHVVLLAENGEEALKTSRGDQGEIDLLITDVMMARMGGLELAKHLLAERPQLRVLLISGYSRDVPLPGYEPNQGVDFLQKPFTPQELARAVARLLSTVRAGSSGLMEWTHPHGGGTKSWTE
jgi:CheY-like chemotaxis protein